MLGAFFIVVKVDIRGNGIRIAGATLIVVEEVCYLKLCSILFCSLEGRLLRIVFVG